jgi:conjugative transposon TraN protein
MKSNYFLSVAVLLLFHHGVQSQNFENIPSTPLWVSCQKTSHIIFPCTVRSVDLGSGDLIAQKAAGAENILQLKAVRENFGETNLSIVTSDGHFYSFLVNYSPRPECLNLRFQPEAGPGMTDSVAVAHFPTAATGNAAMEKISESIARTPQFMYGIRDRSYGIRFILSGLFIKDDVIFFKLEAKNNTQINYDLEVLDFFIKDIRQSRRTSIQELQQHPLYIYHNPDVIKGHSKRVWVVALQKFTIPGKKKLVIQLMEKNGGRNLRLRISNRTLIQARAARGKVRPRESRVARMGRALHN